MKWSLDWGKFPSGLALRVGGMVHRILEIRGNPDGEDTIRLECGTTVQPHGLSRLSEADVDCMACVIRETSRAYDE